jgi:uncharacterized RDD family membrane protein YckC
MFTILGTDGKEYGPVSEATIMGWIAGGRANLQTKARRGNETEWKTLGDFAEFNAAMPPPAVAVTGAAMASASVAPAAGLELASRWLRLGAALLDSIIGTMFAAPGMAMLIMAGVFATPDSPNPALMLAGFVTIGAAMVVLLGIQIYLLVTRGQTLGKKFLGIKIVCFEDDSNPGFVKVFLLRMLVNGLIGAVPFLGLIYSLTDILFIFREDRRCIHDLIAGTKVVKA